MPENWVRGRILWVQQRPSSRPLTPYDQQVVGLIPVALVHSKNFNSLHVSFGSIPDMTINLPNVRFAPKSGHWLARQHVRLVPKGDQARRTKIAERRSC
jgi:hypothetical protein